MSQPILVCMVWRGGERFQRCLESIAESRHHFQRIILSVTSPPDSADVRLAQDFADTTPGVEVLCTGHEMPTMEHQAFWIDYLERTATRPSEWIYWLAYDDQVRLRGIDAIVDDHGCWPLESGTIYLGPWAMRHEGADDLYRGPSNAPLESWTALPLAGPAELPVLTWLRLQLMQPTYLQMSGAVAPFESFLALRHDRPRKSGPMRIEMATALAPPNIAIAEFAEPVSIIYGRPNSDRASYGRSARKQDIHLLLWMLRHHARDPKDWGDMMRLGYSLVRQFLTIHFTGSPPPTEEWRVRQTVDP